MINNKLTSWEFEKILKPIISLQDIEVIKAAMYNILHFINGKPDDPDQYIIDVNSTGVHSTYQGFAIEIRRLNDTKNDYTGVIIQFRKSRDFFDLFINPAGRLARELKRICDYEMSGLKISTLNPGGNVPNRVLDKFLYQTEALNPNWRKENKLSPFTIFVREKPNSFLVEFLFTPDCYERKLNKTVLKDDWLEIFGHYTPSW